MGQEVGGAYLNVAAGGRARFVATAVFMYDAGVTTISEDSMAHGGCVYNEVGVSGRGEKKTTESQRASNNVCRLGVCWAPPHA